MTVVAPADRRATTVEVGGHVMADDETQIQTLIEGRARGDMDGVLAEHSDDIVKFDVPPPNEGSARHGCLSEHLTAVFAWREGGASFDIMSVENTVGADVAFAQLRCGTQEELQQDPDNRPRLTIGLRKSADPGSSHTNITRSPTRTDE
jgi:ketosteroid isomerase-like protein